MEKIAETPAAQGASLSLWHLVTQASGPVLLVMIGLALASIWTWAIIFEKFFAFRKINDHAMKFFHTCTFPSKLIDLKIYCNEIKIEYMKSFPPVHF